MKSRKFLGLILSAILVTYPMAISYSGEGHDHGKEEPSKKDKDDDKDHKGHDHGKEGKDEEGHDDHEEEGVIRLPEESQTLGRIKTKPVEFQALAKKITVTGKAAQDPEKTVYVVSKQDGIIKECKAVLGSPVNTNDLLCVVIGKDQKPLEIKSPANGVIIAELVNAGDKVSSTKPIFALADMNKIGVNFDIYEKDAGQVSLGQDVLVYVQSYPDKTFKGKIVFVSPRMDETSNTLRIKALVDNDDQSLKLGMNVRGQILLNLGEAKYLTVPSRAIQTVENKPVVFVRTSKDEFEAKEIQIVSQDPDTTAIDADIKKGTEIVVEGSFILKSKMLESEMEHSHDH